MTQPINLLFSINDGYVNQFKVTLYSVVKNASRKDFHVYILQKPLLERHEEVKAYCDKLGVIDTPVVIDEQAFENAPTTNRYPETIYYRLLAHEYLPEKLERMLYLDADILCINDLVPLYDMDLGQKLYAAASHTEDSDITDAINRLRLGNYESASYFNSGVLLMNLTTIRQRVNRSDMMSYIAEKGNLLFLPDQDVLTALYGHDIELIPDDIYNYDARYFLIYRAKSKADHGLDWVIEHTVFLHFCGRDKPWKKGHRNVFASLYKHYWHLTKKEE
ncbi:glycosyltransferase family 8 protein [Streptococcus sp. S784/96/1]|uniref:glycosyltransferase family 8 protein n=1 Tax=Streptococcus sp. S784/96/1 TaxID=2653499 RepID=UPI00138698CB|nr:glycosyltransferase family 8 protein [Streptococcus sp. S784/96/1]